MESVRVSAILKDNERLDLVVSSMFIIHFLENYCKFTINMVNLAPGTFSNDLIASDVNSLSRDIGGGSYCFFSSSCNKVALILIKHNLL